MYNAKLDLEIRKVEPYSDTEKGNGIILTGKLETKDRKFFDDINFADKAEGLSRILSGELPIKGTSVKLSFVKPGLEMEFGTSKHIPVELVDLLTGPMVKGVITVELKIDIKRLDKEIAGELSAKLKDFVSIKLNKSQEELALEMKNRNN